MTFTYTKTTNKYWEGKLKSFKKDISIIHLDTNNLKVK